MQKIYWVMERLGNEATEADAAMVISFCEKNEIDLDGADLLDCWEKANYVSAKRKQFVHLRNKMYSKLAELRRQAPHALRVEARNSATDKRTGEQRGLGDHAREIDALKADYKLVCNVSALASPTQEDFDKADSIFKRWNLSV